jgi:4-amino-4-deoxy-L-arabinose transferase-like glycosyltransferase
MNEPSLLDYLKSKLMPWRGIKISIPPMPESQKDLSAAEEGAEPSLQDENVLPIQSAGGVTAEPVVRLEQAPSEEATGSLPEGSGAVPLAAQPGTIPAARAVAMVWPWRSLGALTIALAAQVALEPPRRDAEVGVILYVISAAILVWAILSKEWSLPPLGKDTDRPVSVDLNWRVLLPALPLIVISFLAFGGDLFNAGNLFIWGITIAYVLAVLWQPASRSAGFARFRARLAAWIKNPSFTVKVTPWVILFLLAAALVVYFRIDRLSQVPGEMFSDHAEKLLDISDVLNGKYSIFFPRNTGREAIQMYLTAAIAVLFGTGLSFISLKIATVTAGLLTLPYVYLLGKEIGGKWVGLLAFVLVGIGYWPNLISRIGLRFPLYPAFVAPVLYYFIRALRYQRRNDFILAGLFLGLGLQGYTPMRIVPVVLVILYGLYLLHGQAKNKRTATLIAFGLLAFVAVIFFLPLGRYAVDNSEMFGYRALTRLSGDETPLPGPAIQIFIQNLWKAWIMPFWDNGDIWVHSVVGRPALDIVTAALYFIGSFQVLVRYIRRRHWIDLFLLVSVPLLMLPSILSLAFPGENPSLNRTGAAYIPIFILAAIGLEGILGSFKRLYNSRLAIGTAAVLGLVLVGWSASNNSNLVFVQFNQQFMAGAWNTDQIGQVIRGFADSIGTADTAYVIPYPYWVDTRLVGINAGYPTKDYALAMDQISTTLNDQRAKLFIFYVDDTTTKDVLNQFYPNGKLILHKNPYPGKDFYAFLVPPQVDVISPQN